MSPVLGTSLAASSGSSTQTGLPLFNEWSNPLPHSYSNFTHIDGRKHCLQARNNLWLEMHPNGTRGLNFTTKYCILSIIVLDLFSLSNDSKAISQLGWRESSAGDANNGKHFNVRDTADRPQFVIQSNVTGMFLCMDNESVVYQSKDFQLQFCVFYNRMDTNSLTDQFYRKVNKTSKEWLISLNKDGTVRCGNVTKLDEEGAIFSRKDADSEGLKHVASPPFKRKTNKDRCCKKKRCRQRKKKKCRYKKKQCRTLRRKFFELSLKQLKKYFRNCVKRPKRHCKGNKKS